MLYDQPDAVARLTATPAGAEAIGGDISDPREIGRLLGAGPVAIFHLASIVSGHGERDFDLALRVNLDGARHLLEACRHHDHPVRVTTTSSLAVFGPASGDPVGDDSLVQPATTYGMTKAMLELMINDYSRKGFLDGRAARLPTVIIRPGAPNAAASSAASAIFREPLSGQDYRLPLAADTLMAVASVESVIDNLITLHELPAESFDGRRTVTFPGVSATFIQMLEVLHDQVPAERLGPVTVEPDQAVQDDRADLADPGRRVAGCGARPPARR